MCIRDRSLGVGSGYLKHEFEGYDVDPATKRERFDENLMLVERLLAGERVSHEGKFNRIHEVRLNVQPVQQPVPVYVAILRREAASVSYTHLDVYKRQV